MINTIFFPVSKLFIANKPNVIRDFSHKIIL